LEHTCYLEDLEALEGVTFLPLEGNALELKKLTDSTCATSWPQRRLSNGSSGAIGMMLVSCATGPLSIDI